MLIQTDQLVQDFLLHCLSMEASGNHGSYGSGPGGTVAMRRGIWFWGTGRGWQLYKNWREEFNRKWPDITLPPKPAPPPRRKPVARARLERLVKEYRTVRPDISYLEYWPRGYVRSGEHVGWYLWLTEEAPAPGRIYLGQNSREAYESLKTAITIEREKDLS